MFSYRPSCSYRDCKNKSLNKSYFELPTDNRREIWLRNAGIAENMRYKQPIWICEDHFDPKFMYVTEDGRKLLFQYTNVVPVHWQSTTARQPSDLITSNFAYDEQATQMLQIFESGEQDQQLYDYFLSRGNYGVASSGGGGGAGGNEIQTTLVPNIAEQAAAAAAAAVQPTQMMILNPIMNQNFMLQSQQMAVPAQLLATQQILYQQPIAVTLPQVVTSGHHLTLQHQQQQQQSQAQAQSIIHQSAATVAAPPAHRQPERRPRGRRSNANREADVTPTPPKDDVLCFQVKTQEQREVKMAAGNSSSDDIEEMLDTFFIVNDKKPGAAEGLIGHGGDGGIILGK